MTDIVVTAILIFINMHRQDFTMKDRRPYYMDVYLKHHGPHFNKQLMEYAVSRMYKTDMNGNKISIKPYTREEVEELLKKHNVILKSKDILSDHVYIANMCKFDFLGSSIEDELHVARYIKNVIDDPDGYDGMVFTHWYTDMCKKGIPIDWEIMI